MTHRPSSPTGRQRVLAAMTTAVLAAAALAGCTPSEAPATGQKDLTLGVAMVSVPNWDPAQAGDILTQVPLMSAVYESLAYYDFNTNEVVPVLAQSLEVADDGLSMNVTLRDDVDFVDGVHLDATGAVKSLEYMLGSEAFAFGGQVLPYAPTFEVTGDYTFTIATVIPIYIPASFDALLGTPILSPEAIDDPERIATEPVGTGPYELEDFVPDVSASFSRNPNYRDPDAYPFDTVTFQAIADPVARLNAVKSGQVDTVMLNTSLAAEALSSDLNVTLQPNINQYLFIRDPENSKTTALRDVRVRQAIMFAIDRKSIAENIYGGFAEPAYQMYGVAQPEYIEGGDDQYSYDPDHARELMAEAGYADGFDISIPTAPDYSEVEPVLTESLAAIGIRVTWVPITGGGGFDFFVACFDGSYEMCPQQDPQSQANRLLDVEFTGVGSLFEPGQELRDLLNGVRSGDPETSYAASQDLGHFLLDDIWYVPIVVIPDVYASASGVEVKENAIFALNNIAPKS